MTASEELIQRANRNSNLIRVGYTLLAVLVMGVLIFIALSAGHAKNQLQQQLQNDHAASLRSTNHLNQILDEVRAQNSLQQSYILCIAQFFSQPDRTNLTLGNTPDCKIESANGSTSTITPTSAPSPTATPEPSQTAQTYSSTTSDTPATPTPSPRATATSTPAATPTAGQQTPFESIVKTISGLL
jgi:type II secretory pathway pseudopilin PulG